MYQSSSFKLSAAEWRRQRCHANSREHGSVNKHRIITTNATMK
jgi:hypothetical protein